MLLRAWLAGRGSALAEEAKFGYTGAEQTFVVPAGVTSVQVVAIGSEGGTVTNAALGGVGAVVRGELSVTPEEVLFVEVGGVPFNGGGASTHGGGGGGASDVRTVSIGAEPSPGNEASLNSRLLVAAGGGGGGRQNLGGTEPICPGGAGGAAEEKGANGTSCGFPPGEGGGAGEANKGGAGGLSYFMDLPSNPGEAGRLGAGGRAFLSGGGGGGLYGGGGGGEQEVEENSGGGHRRAAGSGGGGGGSDLVPAGGEPKLATVGEATSVTITKTPLPTSIAQCQKNGWKSFGTKFKNQGQCIKFVETGR